MPSSWSGLMRSSRRRSTSATSRWPSSTSSTASASGSGRRSSGGARVLLTATPIPRTLALTVYGDLEVRRAALPPANRKPVVTAWVTRTVARRPTSASVVTSTTGARPRRLPVDRGVGDQGGSCRRGRGRAPSQRRAPRIPRGLSPRSPSSGRAAEHHGELQGRRSDVLVATTVIEVGVDVPNATIMIVQEADRVRPRAAPSAPRRVGRGAAGLLVSRAKEELTEGASERLGAMVATTDGFELCGARPRDRGRASSRRAPVRLLGSPFRPSSSRPGFVERARDVAREDRGRWLLGVDRLLGESEHLGGASRANA